MHTARLALPLAAVFAAALPAPFAASAQGAPAVTGVAVTSDAGADATYALGETVEVTVTFGEAVDVTGTPGLAIDMDPASWGEKRAAYASGSGTAALVFAHAVVEPNFSTRGIAVLGNTLALNGGTIRSASSGAEASLTHTGLPHDAAHKVDWRLSPRTTTRRATTPRQVRSAATGPAATAPAVTGMEVTSEPGADATYALGETVEVTVRFSEAVAVTGAPGLAIDMDAAHWGEKRAAYASGSGTASLLFAHEVVEPNLSTRGIAVLANTLALHGGSIRSASGADAALAHAGLPHDAAHKVDWRLSPRHAARRDVTPDTTPPDTTPPEVVRGEIDGRTVTLTFSEALDPASAGGEFRVTVYSSNGNAWSFVAGGDVEIGGNVVTVGLGPAGPGKPWAKAGVPSWGSNRLQYTAPADPGAVRLRDLAGNAMADTQAIALDNVTAPPPDTTPSDTTPPEVVRGEIDGGTVTLTFSEALDPASAGGEFQVTVYSSNGNAWSFAAGGDVEIDGDTVTVGLGPAGPGKPWAKAGVPSWGSNRLQYTAPAAPGAVRLRDLAGNAVADTQSIALDNVTAPPPAVTEVEVTSDAGADATYALGETVRVAVTFGEAVNVTGTPRLKLGLGSGAERWADYESGGGTAALAFAWTVAQGDASGAGVAVLANTLALNGGAIRSRVSGKDAALAHAGLPHDANHKVDGTLPDTTPPRLSRTVVDGATMRLAFNEAIDTAASLANSDFTVKKTPPGGTEETVGLRGSPAVDGAAVTLTLAQAVRGADTGVKVSYRRSPDTGDRLRDEAGNEVADFSDEPVANSEDTTPPELVRGEIDGGTVTLYFSEALDEDATGGHFQVHLYYPKCDGRPLGGPYSGLTTCGITFGATGGVEISGNVVTVGLGQGNPRARADLPVSFYYTLPADSARGLRDLAGNPVRTPRSWYDGTRFTRIPLDNLTAPSVTGVAVSSEAGDDDTYAQGETIRVRLTFSAAVAVTGTPRVKLDLSSEAGDEKWAAYASGSGTKVLEFAWTVAQGDESSAGVAVLKDTLALNGGTIRQVARSKDADLPHAALGHDPSHKVDGIAPTLSAATVDRSTLTLTFSETLGAASSLANSAFTVKKTPQGGTEEAVSLSGTPAIDGATVSLTLASAVLSADTGVKVSYTVPGSETGSRLRDAVGNEVASFSDQPVAKSADTTPPELVRGEIDGGTVTLYFSETLDPDSTAGRFKLQVEYALNALITFYAAGEVMIDGSTVTVGPGAGIRRAIAGGRNNYFSGYSAPTDPAVRGLRDLAGNEVGDTQQIIRLDNLTGVARLSVADARANEGAGASVAFEVSLSNAATETVTVDYATADGTAEAGSDYTATSGTLTFAAGETSKTVSVPVLDDAVDEGEETFTLRLSNAAGARIRDGEAVGTIVNDDPLQKMWLSRFGRTVASHVTDAVSDRLAAPIAGAQVTVAGQRVDLAQAEDGAALAQAQALTGLARALGAAEHPAPGDGPDGFGAGGWPGTGLGRLGSPTLDSAPVRRMSGRELLRGSAFHLAAEGDDGGPGLAAWGRVVVGGFDGEAPADAGSVRGDGEVTTGILGADAEWNRLLAGVAISVSEGEGRFAQPGVDEGTIESTMTTVSPYARLKLNERLSAWGLLGWGTGDMTIVQAANEDTGQPERTTRADLEMRLAAVGGRGALLEADEAGGIDLGLKADAFWVETEAEAVSNEGGTTAVASRVRLALEGSRAFRMGGGGTLTPGVELGLRHDGGDAETGAGVELGGRVAYEDPETGLGVEARVRTLVAHENSAYREWGASGAVRLAPGASGRGLSFSLSPTWGAASSGVDRLWSAHDAGSGAGAGPGFEAGQRLEGEIGYGLGLLGGRLTGTPNVGFGLSDTTRDYRVGWRLTAPGDPGFAVHLDATRRESVNDNAPAEHGAMLRGAIRW